MTGLQKSLLALLLAGASLASAQEEPSGRITLSPPREGARSSADLPGSFLGRDRRVQPPVQPADGSTSGSDFGPPAPATCYQSVIPEDTFGSSNVRAPIPRFRYARQVYLITPAELARHGMPSNTTIHRIQWNYFRAPDVQATAPLTIYLQNTTDTQLAKSTDWTTAITGMTTVHSASTALPSGEGYFEVVFTGGSTFTYTGGGIYVAFDWGPYPGDLTTTGTVAGSNTPGGILGAQDNDSAPTTLTEALFRPETGLAFTTQNDVLVSNVYVMGQHAANRTFLPGIQVLVRNFGTLPKTGIPVTLTVTGPNPYTETVMTGDLDACKGFQFLTFSSAYQPTALGDHSVTVSVPADDNTANDSLAAPMKVTLDQISHTSPDIPEEFGLGISSVGALAAFFHATPFQTILGGVTVNFANSGSTRIYKITILGSSFDERGLLPNSFNVIYDDMEERTVDGAGPVTIEFPEPVVIEENNFYVVVEQLDENNIGVACEVESPMRSPAFASAVGSLDQNLWSSLGRRGQSYKLDIRANLLEPPPTPTPTNGPPATVTPTITATATPTATSTWTPTSPGTPTRTPTSAFEAHFVRDNVSIGQPVQAEGNLPPGNYTLCVVNQGTYTLGMPYNGGSIACTPATTTRGTFGPITVWQQSQAGSYDLLALGSGNTIVAGDGLDSSAGVTVANLVPASGRLLPILALLLAAILALRPGKRQTQL